MSDEQNNSIASTSGEQKTKRKRKLSESCDLDVECVLLDPPPKVRRYGRKDKAKYCAKVRFELLDSFLNESGKQVMSLDDLRILVQGRWAQNTKDARYMVQYCETIEHELLNCVDLYLNYIPKEQSVKDMFNFDYKNDVLVSVVVASNLFNAQENCRFNSLYRKYCK